MLVESTRFQTHSCLEGYIFGFGVGISEIGVATGAGASERTMDPFLEIAKRDQSTILIFWFLA